jgi:hypothetical protein
LSVEKRRRHHCERTYRVPLQSSSFIITTMSSTITKVHARQVYDSRGNPVGGIRASSSALLIL